MKFKITSVALLVASVSLAGCGSGGMHVGNDSSPDDSENTSADVVTEAETIIDNLIDDITGVDDSIDPDTIVSKLQTMGGFDTLVSALQATGLDTKLSGEGPFTLFAPDDEAFNKLGADKIIDLLATPDTLREILLYHVLDDQFVDATTAASLADTKVESASGKSFTVGLDDDTLTINSASVIQADIGTGNGIIHRIDTVLTPPGDGPLTNVFDALQEHGLTELVEALIEVDLADDLCDTSKQFTVFAPTNEAFKAMTEANLDTVMDNAQELTKVLLNHVVSDTMINSDDAKSLLGQPLETMAKEKDLIITEFDHELFVENAKLVITDIQTENGIVHVIDTAIQALDL